MIKSSGLLCDVCNSYILPTENEYETFTLTMFDDTFHCHSRCKKEVEKMMAEKTYKYLPIGNIRNAFERAESKIAEQQTTADKCY